MWKQLRGLMTPEREARAQVLGEIAERMNAQHGHVPGRRPVRYDPASGHLVRAGQAHTADEGQHRSNPQGRGQTEQERDVQDIGRKERK